MIYLAELPDGEGTLKIVQNGYEEMHAYIDDVEYPITKFERYRDGGTTTSKIGRNAFYWPTPFAQNVTPTWNGKPMTDLS